MPRAGYGMEGGFAPPQVAPPQVGTPLVIIEMKGFRGGIQCGRRARSSCCTDVSRSDLFMYGERVVIKSHASIWGTMISETRSHRALSYASEKEAPCPMKI